MKCVSTGCSLDMEHRQGKYGGFWYCPTHGTISDKGMAIIQALQRQSVGCTCVSYKDLPGNDPLMIQIHRETLAMGVQTSELEDWIVDNPDAAEDEEDHWMNQRPY